MPWMLLVLAIARSSPNTPAEPAWRIEITTTGGFTGLGAGGLTITPDGKLVLRAGCELRLRADDLKAIADLVMKAKPEEWKPSYVSPSNPSGCCDMVKTTLTISRGPKRWSSSWFNEHVDMPSDLKDLAESVWGPFPKNVCGRYRAQCKP